MNLLKSVKLVTRGLSPQQIVSESWDDKNSILSPNVNLFCWKRNPVPLISALMESLIEKEPIPIRFQTTISQLDQQLEEIKSMWFSPFTIELSGPFWNDVAMLIKDFLTLSSKQSGIVHLKMVSNDACSKFHTDAYSLRLFTTYFGEGTQWLPETAVNRQALGKSNDLIVKDPTQIQNMRAFDVGILKGERDGALSGVKGIVHRSPSISISGGKRIVLRVDIQG